MDHVHRHPNPDQEIYALMNLIHQQKLDQKDSDPSLISLLLALNQCFYGMQYRRFRDRFRSDAKALVEVLEKRLDHPDLRDRLHTIANLVP